MTHWFSSLGDHWKAVIALAGAAGAGAGAGAYLTLPRTVAALQQTQVEQEAVLHDLTEAVLANTRAVRLISCTQAASLIRNEEESRMALHGCIATYGLGAEDG